MSAAAPDRPVGGELTPERASRFERTYRSMQPWLPRQCSEFLDIGCGLGGVAIWVSRHYGGQARANLIDGAGDAGEKWTSYRADGQPWADVRVALRLFAKHVPGAPVQAWAPEGTQALPPCELVYSNCSWGHHYPIETYLALVDRVLKPFGTLIVDLRVGEVGAHGRKVLGERFGYRGGIAVGEGKKYERTVWGRE